MSLEKPSLQRDFESLNILMAEDDKLNQALAKVVFKKLGCTYDIVETGVKVFEKLEQTQYDFILMDIEMPELNGYETTKRIRNELANPLSKIPILAITAHVNEMDLKKCMDVGMNGYIFKPIKLQELTDKIKLILQMRDDFPSKDQPAQQQPAAGKTSFNLDNLYAACGDNQETVKNIIGLFIAQTSSNMENLHKFLQLQDWQAFKNLCHKMKAVYSLVGLPEVKTSLAEMEDDCTKNTVNVSKFESNLAFIHGLNVSIIPEMEKILATK